MLTNTMWGLSTTCSFQLELVSVTTLDENKSLLVAVGRRATKKREDKNDDQILIGYLFVRDNRVGSYFLFWIQV